MKNCSVEGTKREKRESNEEAKRAIELIDFTFRHSVFFFSSLNNIYNNNNNYN